MNVEILEAKVQVMLVHRVLSSNASARRPEDSKFTIHGWQSTFLRQPQLKSLKPSMKLTIDQQADALYLRFDDAPIVDSHEVAPGVVLDYDEDEKVVGVEVLKLSERSSRSR